MDPNLKCCVLGCHTRLNQGFRFYRFPCHNPQISSIWKQRISQSTNTDFDILNDHVCELHFDYRCKSGNECALEEGSLPTLHLPSVGTLFSTGNEHFQMSANRIEEPWYTLSIDALSYHCRFCLRRGLLYEVEASTYRSKSFLSLIDIPPDVFPDNIHPNACLTCLKSIVIAHQLSMAIEHSNTILQQLLQHPKQSLVVSNTNFFDIKTELAFFNLILANSQSIKLEIEIEDKMVWVDEDYEQKLVGVGGSTSPVAYVNAQKIEENSICIAENQDNISKMYDSFTFDEQCQNEFHKSFAIKGESTTDLCAEGIPDASENSDFCVLMENTDYNSEVRVSNNSDDSCVEDRQFDNEQAPESTGKVVNEPTYKCDLCKFTTNYKANLAIHKNLHLAGNDTVHFDCQKCEKGFLLRRHFVRHNAIVHADDFTCKICDKPHASATKLAVHYTEHHHFQYDISPRMLRSGRHAHILDHKQETKTFTTKDEDIHYNDDVYVCPIYDWKTASTYTFNAHRSKHVQSNKNVNTGSQDLETLETDLVRNADGKCQRSECPKAFVEKQDFGQHKRTHTNERPHKCSQYPKTVNHRSGFNIHRRIHTNERPYQCSECPKTFSNTSNFIQHKRTHIKEKPHKCIECSKSFSRKGSLDMHKRLHTSERPYKCSECPKAFSQKGSLHIHKRIHTNERPYKCSECHKTFIRKDSLDIHKRIHTNERPYKCSECHKTFIRKYSLDIHKRIHTNERPYRCSECPKTFIQKGRLDNHKRTHTNERPYKCSQCPKTFNHKCSLVIHNKEHTNEIPYQCSECPKIFYHQIGFNVHRRIHTNERPYQCSECPKSFNHQSGFYVHRRIHTNERPYQCSECPKTFNNTSNFIRHKRTHINEKPHKCIECSKSFSRKGSLDIHKRLHTNERPYKCSECPKTFNQKGSLHIHKRIHTNERSYKCSDCQKTFIRKDSLDLHKRIHTNERPYKCSECSKTYSQKISLSTHKRIHTKEKRYKCTECPKTFSDNSSLIQHKRVHTNERPYKCTECPKAFVDNSSFSRHKYIHTNERPHK